VITQRAPSRSQQSYRHEALLWHTPEDFTDTLVAFVDEGLDAGEPVMVAVTPQHTAWLQDALGRRAAQEVQFVDMMALGQNPARIIPAWRDFVETESGGRGPVRGIGEPIWPGRHAEELLECQLHEALLNVAIEPATPLWLICPYDAASLDADVLAEAARSHPVLVEAGSHRGSAHYVGRPHADALFGAGLSEPRGRPQVASYTADTIHRLLAYAKLELWITGLSAEQASQLAAATELLARGSLHRGSAEVAIRIWSDPDAVVCEVSDDAPVSDPLHGRSLPVDEHEGLWRANQACDLVQLRSAEGRTTVRILTWKREATTASR
jgi:hypothetical protein